MVSAGRVNIGADADISVQSMTNTDTRSAADTLRQVRALSDAGADLVRVAVVDRAAAFALGEICTASPVPIVADIHFDHRLALDAIRAGAAKVRINPGNLKRQSHVAEVVSAAKRAGVPIRIGVNAGSLPEEIVRTHGAQDRLEELAPVCDTASVVHAIRTIREVRVSEPIERYLIAVCRATRGHHDVELGASPRASLALIRSVRVTAAIAGRDHVVPDDVKLLAPHVLPHRLILRPNAELAGVTATDVITDVLSGMPVPTE